MLVYRRAWTGYNFVGIYFTFLKILNTFRMSPGSGIAVFSRQSSGRSWKLLLATITVWDVCHKTTVLGWRSRFYLYILECIKYVKLLLSAALYRTLSFLATKTVSFRTRSVLPKQSYQRPWCLPYAARWIPYTFFDTVQRHITLSYCACLQTMLHLYWKGCVLALW